MLAHLRLISADKLSGYIKRPDTFYRDFPRLRQAQAQSPTDGNTAKQSPVFVAAVRAAQQPRARPPIPAQPTAVELQKSWHCLNYIWTGEATLEESATSESPLLGGRAIADQGEIMAYGPVRYFTAPKAYALSGLLAAFPWRQRIAEYDPVAARAFDIYAPDHASDELEYFSELLTAFYGHAARAGSGVLSWIE